MKRILVLGGGFAGLWSAVGAVRKLDELGISTEKVEVTLVNRDPYHSIRVRNYEADLSRVRIPLDDVLIPIGVKRVEGEVVNLNFSAQTVTLARENKEFCLSYDRLVFALGSQLWRPELSGLAEYAFSVDTYSEAVKLNAHLQTLPDRADVSGRYSVLVVGSGLTGIETAAEIPDKLRSAIKRANKPDVEMQQIRVILADHSPNIGSDLGESARPIIQEALTALGIEIRTNVSVVAIDPSGAKLSSGEFIPAATVIWTAGMRANPLTKLFPVVCDRFGRIPVDQMMKVKEMENIFAAGDGAWTWMDDTHPSVMSCQHGRPMGRFAGHNVVSDLLGKEMLPLRIEWYVTVLDLGSWGALYMEGWERKVVATRETAKKTKQIINQYRIYPPLSKNRSEIISSARPIVQSPPEAQ